MTSIKELNSNDWTLYLTRPFTLFGASLWHKWYSCDLFFEIFGLKMDAVFIGKHDGTVAHYKLISQMNEFVEAQRRIAKNKNLALKVLHNGVTCNEIVSDKLSGNIQPGNLNEEVEFLNKLAIYATIIPYFLPNHTSDKDILNLCEALRGKSYYDDFIEKIILPLAKKVNLNADNVVFEELESNARNEILAFKTFKLTYYQNNYLVEHGDFNFVSNDVLDEVKGSVAYKGNVTGTARIFSEFHNENFVKGDIIVAASTSPKLMPYLEKAGGIITNEGGLMCHAAIIARELKIPCIIGTKNATMLIKDGDVVSLNLDGAVKIIKN